jgi:ATP-dependent DNA helicase DinG
VGVVLVDPDRPSLTVLESLVRPGGSIPRSVQRLTGLSDDDVADAPRVDSISQQIREALSGRVIVAHNADFERRFLSRFVSPTLEKSRYLDTQDFLAIAHPDAPDLRLETFTRTLLDSDERHRALSDALDTLRVLSAAAVGSRKGERRYQVARSALETYAADSPWLALLGRPAKGTLPQALPPEPGFVVIPESDEAPVPFDADAIASVLSDADRGLRHFPGYRVRDEQIRMAREFVRTFAEGGRLLLEGGTGVGKSLAYLSAAIPFAMERAAGGERSPVLVSTRTKLLQDQLLMKDIPAAAAMLGYPDLMAISIKGRANYACARRLSHVLAEGREPSIFPEDRLAYAALSACAKTRRHGEVGTVPGALLFRFPPLRDLLRRSVAARAEQCTREQCASERDCPLGRRRSELSQAHLVVANHDLMLRWPPDYPPFQVALADEAHELSGVADEVYALEVRPDAVLERLDDLFGRPGEGPRGEALLPSGQRRSVRSDARAWRRGVSQDLIELGRCLGDDAGEYGEVHLPAYAADRHPKAAELADRAAHRLEDVADAVEPEDEPGDDDDAASEAVVRAVADLRGAARALRGAFASDGEESVASFERLEPPFDRWRLVVRPVSPAEPFHERFLDGLDSLACVSASLFVSDDPFAAMGELDIESGEKPRRVRVPSPFPYAEHMRVVAMDPRGDLVEETAAVLADLTRLLGGRTLGLFTSLRRMRDVAELLHQSLRGEGYDVLSPRRASDDPSALVERFSRAGGGGVLLGARTFWQGIDIPGDALQAVVIEKLPFEVPTELRKRREARLKEAGESPFEKATMGKMLLNLKQMTGRLIRSEEDRGVVVIVEGRPDRRYFRRLSEALPESNQVRVVARADLPAILAEVGIG